MKYQIGDKVLLLPCSGMLYGYADDMVVLSNTVTTITDIRESTYLQDASNIKVESNSYSWGEDSIVYIPDNIIYVPYGVDAYVLVEKVSRRILHTYTMSDKDINVLLDMNYTYSSLYDVLRETYYREENREDLIEFLKGYSLVRENEIKYEGKYIYISKHAYNILYDMMPNVIDISRKTVGSNGIVSVKVINNLSSSNTNYLYNNKKGEFFTKGTNQKIKIGKIVAQLDPSLDSTQIEWVVSAWKKRYTVDISRVCVSTDIGDVYDISSIGGSCMANKGELMQIYSDVGCKIAYMLDSDGNLAARCIYWDNNIEDSEGVVCSAYDRIFHKTENDKLTLERYFSDLGIPIITSKYYTTIKSTERGYDEGVPYIDNMYYVTDNYKLTNMNNDNIVDTLQHTDGSSNLLSSCRPEDSVYCEDTENYAHIEEAYYNQTRECYYESVDDLVYIEDRGYYEEDDDEVVYCEDTGDYRMTDDAWNCENSENWYYNDDTRVETYCGSIFHIDHIPDEYYLVEDTGEWMDSSSEELIMYKKDGLIYTLEYYREELEPDHMEVL